MGFSPAAGVWHAGDLVRVGAGLSPAATGNAGVGPLRRAGHARESGGDVQGFFLEASVGMWV
jgi:hypothetical protein